MHDEWLVFYFIFYYFLDVPRRGDGAFDSAVKYSTRAPIIEEETVIPEVWIDSETTTTVMTSTAIHTTMRPPLDKMPPITKKPLEWPSCALPMEPRVFDDPNTFGIGKSICQYIFVVIK